MAKETLNKTLTEEVKRKKIYVFCNGNTHNSKMSNIKVNKRWKAVKRKREDKQTYDECQFKKWMKYIIEFLIYRNNKNTTKKMKNIKYKYKPQ